MNPNSLDAHTRLQEIARTFKLLGPERADSADACERGSRALVIVEKLAAMEIRDHCPFCLRMRDIVTEEPYKFAHAEGCLYALARALVQEG